MTSIEILAARLAESILMDWDKEQQVDLAHQLVVELLKKQYDEEPDTTENKPLETPSISGKGPFEPVVVMYGTQTPHVSTPDYTIKTTKED